ncbi:Lamina-associated polypeptide 2, isoform alpha [Varanus komodoensis]|uniref:ribosomal RNA processing protein 36 homolog isoform X1 n=1 Tax=Varanus komodoensis TaxID=61221 RepID=UPI001CF7E44A|nr:ribosomal RNA processing protein 36 homolog isoform X1 [Varanus komodoensis]XP_044284932.1 ribosomal RNA processing protein 36 homolog isoform X1 [Varanus komodoensis]XP_044284933.1 ribosomal RNA processing protein 36 homolog isoform X1 [Varanus komodoensis]XP_044284934.1 ribosomal RNA processing protein 36 homolog isoform X1 [Varanus komodoensis]XP_044284935.1 ribosomal RNA processing protein 36 homolog isoform X1 [Varanus komodoensis]XP_044284936.1 ribosomal RNA processing protein 36 homo
MKQLRGSKGGGHPPEKSSSSGKDTITPRIQTSDDHGQINILNPKLLAQKRPLQGLSSGTAGSANDAKRPKLLPEVGSGQDSEDEESNDSDYERVESDNDASDDTNSDDDDETDSDASESSNEDPEETTSQPSSRPDITKERRYPTSPGNSSSSGPYCYETDSEESEVDSTSPHVAITLQGPGSPEEPHITFGELMTRLVRSLEIKAQRRVDPSTDKFYDIVRGEQSAAIVLPLITTLRQAMVQPWDLPAQPQPTSRRYEAMYRVQERDIPFLLHHPKPNSVVVESSQGRESRGHTAPRDKESRKIDMLARRVYAASGLGLRISNYEATLARYQYFIMQKLDNIAASLPDQQRDLAKIFIKEAMQVAIQQLSTARHHVDTDSRALVGAISLRRHAWLRSCNFPEEMKRRIEEMPFDGLGLFHARTDHKLKSVHESRMTARWMELLTQPRRKWSWSRPSY